LAITFLGIFFFSLLCAFVLTRYVRDYATAHGWVSAPSQERHLHISPLPRLGGVAIFVSFTLSMAVSVVLALYSSHLHAVFSLKTLVTIFVPASVIFLLGVYDDIRGAGPYLKFSVQALAAVMLFMGGLRIVNIPVAFGPHTLPWFVGLPLTVLWVLAITNAFNLIDGLDGLAAGSALFSTLVAFVVALINGPTLVSVMTLALAGAILGFLRFNFNPATIFLGDSGSLFIGFLLSALALEGAQKAPTIVAVAIPVVSFGLPILETSLSVIRRLISGRPVFTADREHIHHKLLQHGLTHRQVVILLYGVSAVFAMLSLLLLWPTGNSLGVVLAVLGVGIWIGVQHLGYLEFGELARVAQRTLDQRQIFINNMSIRRAAEELKVARDYDQVRRILIAAFGSNDFDGFDLQIAPLPNEPVPFSVPDSSQPRRSEFSFRWSKPGGPKSFAGLGVWTLTLDLRSNSNHSWGMLLMYRLYSQPDIQLDINLLTATFTTTLANSLERAFTPAIEIIPLTASSDFIAAQAG